MSEPSATVELIRQLPAILTALAAIGAMIVSMLTYRAQVKTRAEVAEVKAATNGMKDALIFSEKALSRAQGVEEGATQGSALTDTAAHAARGVVDVAAGVATDLQATAKQTADRLWN